MAYVTKLIGKEENLIGIARLHWIYVARGLLWLATMGIIGATISAMFGRGIVFLSTRFNGSAFPELLMTLQDNILIFFLFAGALMFSGYLAKFLVTEIALTSRRVIHKEGFIFVKVRDIDLEEIRGENLDLGWLGRFLNYGYLLLDCRFLGDVRLPALAKAETFLKALHYHRSHTQDAVSVVVGKGNAAPVEFITPQNDIPSGPTVQINQQGSPVTVSSVAPHDVPHNAIPEPRQPTPEVQPEPQPQQPVTPPPVAPPPQPEIQPQQQPPVPEIQPPPQAQAQQDLVAQTVAQVVQQVVPQIVKEMQEQGVIQPPAQAEKPPEENAPVEEELLSAFDEAAFQTHAKSVEETAKAKRIIH